MTANLSHNVVGIKAHINGKDVKNTNKENLGTIEDVVVDKQSGQVLYVVLSFGGFLGMGDKLFALPWKVLSYSPEDDSFIISVSKEKLEKAPGFNKDHWPNMADPTFAQSIHDYYL